MVFALLSWKMLRLDFLATWYTEQYVARPERFELPTLWFEARCSDPLSYGRVGELSMFIGAFAKGRKAHCPELVHITGVLHVLWKVTQKSREISRRDQGERGKMQFSQIRFRAGRYLTEKNRNQKRAARK